MFSSRNNIIQKLCGGRFYPHIIMLNSWSSLPRSWILRVRILNSAHVAKLNSQPNKAMRLISDTIKSTTTHWFLTLTAVIPPLIRRTDVLIKEFTKINLNWALPIHDFIDYPVRLWLKSRNRAIKTVADFNTSNSDMMTKWKQTWTDAVKNGNLLSTLTPGHTPTGFDLPRNL